jgi:aminoglycoside phosphotransferase (APT) family kinase protein
VTAAAAFDTAAVRMALDQVSDEKCGGHGLITSLRHRRSRYSSSFPVDALDVRFEDGTVNALVMKNLSRDAMLPTARATRPPFFDDPRREIDTYRNILDTRVCGTPRFYGAIGDERCGRYWLFLERIPGLQLCDVGRLATWEEAARWLGRLHAESPSESLLDDWQRQAHLVRYDRTFLELWGERAGRLLVDARFPAADVRRLVLCHQRAANLLMGQAATFIHGEFYPSNILASRGAHARRLSVVDWELASVGPALIDLAALTSGDWPERRRARIIAAYRNAWVAAGRTPVPDGDFDMALNACRLHLAVRWLGWSAQWTPPERHAHNWWDEAVTTARGFAA